MTPRPFSERRRAERFAQLLDEAQGAPHRHVRTGHDEELAPVVELGHTMATGLAAVGASVKADDDFKARLRGRLMAKAAVHGIGTTADDAETVTEPPPPRPRGGRRLILGLAVLVGIVGVSGVSAASGDAMPGDALYDLKRSTESAQLALAGSDVNRGQLYLEFARNRLDEAEAVADDPARSQTALADMDEETTQGVGLLTGASVERADEGVLDAIDAFVDAQRVDLVDFISTLPTGAPDEASDTRARALDSLGLLDDVEERADKLRFSLLCTASGDAKMDELGPVPVTCSALPADTTHDPGAVETDPQASRDSRTDPPTEATPSETPTEAPDTGEDDGEDEGLLDLPTETPGLGDDPTSTDGGDDEDEGLLGTIGGILSGLLGG